MKRALLLIVLLLLSTPLLATETGSWYLQTSAYTKHWQHNPDHNNHQELVGIERHMASGYLWGGATFLNSFDQRSYYAYYGRQWTNDKYPVYAKLSGGAIQGYKGEYDDKIPLNHLGVAPVIIPSFGTFYGPVSAELVILGNAAVMINVGYRFK
ncbi:sn-glycerol-3-phosphate transporter [Pseudomonas mosselii]|uniref:sn-glycerol-3-phosphate transporter n=1 Tax=Pseudomonas mosselii TaxID=78327 RepID=UPI003F2F4326